MTLEEAYEKRRQEVLSLKRQLNKAEKIIGELTAGTYVDSEKAEHLRTINRLSQEVKHLNNKIERFKGWYEAKDRAGIDEDSILAALSPDTIVMHDHNTINYNDDFQFQNIECNEHLSRDLQSLIDDSGHSWCKGLKEMIQKAEHDRKLLMEKGYTSFDDEYIQDFNRRLDELLEKAEEEYQTSSNRYFETDERRLIARLKKYRESYFMWLSDFTLPTTNNLSERSLRFAKTKQKASGQFVSQKYSEYFADIRTYIETCYRNRINWFKALRRLTASNPYTLAEVLGEA